MQSKTNKKAIVLRLRGIRARARRVVVLGFAITLSLTSLPLLAAILGRPNNDQLVYGLGEADTTERSNKEIAAPDLPRQDHAAGTTSSFVQNSDGDWPMLQHDAQRSGYTDQEVRPPYEFLWRWHAPPLASRTQPVVAGGILYIGSLDGNMYALNAMTGEIIWTRETGGPIRHSAAVVDGKVFFGSHDTNIYALDAATGGALWSFPTGAGISTAPVVGNGMVYIGSRDGFFYALDADTGYLQWKYETGGPIETSAALSEDGTIVFFGSEDMHAYAVYAASGGLKWKTKLPGGQSMRDRWPVVIGDKVIFRTQPLVNFQTLMQAEDELFDSLGADPDWSTVEKPAIIDFLSDNPHYRDFFVLDIYTGQEKFIAPVLYSGGNGDIADMPVVNRDTGEVFVRYRFTGGFLNELGIGKGASLDYSPAIGKMDLVNNDITPVDPEDIYDFNWQFHMISDETSHFSLGGSMLFVDSWTRLGGIDVKTRELFEVANVINNWSGCGDVCDVDGPMPVYDYAFPYDPAISVQAEGRSWRPTIIADGVIYWVITATGDGTELQPSALAAIQTGQQ